MSNATNLPGQGDCHTLVVIGEILENQRGVLDVVQQVCVIAAVIDTSVLRHDERRFYARMPVSVTPAVKTTAGTKAISYSVIQVHLHPHRHVPRD